MLNINLANQCSVFVYLSQLVRYPAIQPSDCKRDNKPVTWFEKRNLCSEVYKIEVICCNPLQTAWSLFSLLKKVWTIIFHPLNHIPVPWQTFHMMHSEIPYQTDGYWILVPHLPCGLNLPENNDLSKGWAERQNKSLQDSKKIILKRILFLELCVHSKKFDQAFKLPRQPHYLCVHSGCKENHFYSLPFWQAYWIFLTFRLILSTSDCNVDISEQLIYQLNNLILCRLSTTLALSWPSEIFLVYCVHHNVGNSLLRLTIFGRESCLKSVYSLE